MMMQTTSNMIHLLQHACTTSLSFTHAFLSAIATSSQAIEVRLQPNTCWSYNTEQKSRKTFNYDINLKRVKVTHTVYPQFFFSIPFHSFCSNQLRLISGSPLTCLTPISVILVNLCPPLLKFSGESLIFRNLKIFEEFFFFISLHSKLPYQRGWCFLWTSS